MRQCYSTVFTFHHFPLSLSCSLESLLCFINFPRHKAFLAFAFLPPNLCSQLPSRHHRSSAISISLWHLTEHRGVIPFRSFLLYLMEDIHSPPPHRKPFPSFPYTDSTTTTLAIRCYTVYNTGLYTSSVTHFQANFPSRA